jgi:hypothetical protein
MFISSLCSGTKITVIVCIDIILQREYAFGLFNIFLQGLVSNLRELRKNTECENYHNLSQSQADSLLIQILVADEASGSNIIKKT